MNNFDISELASRASQFDERLQRLKGENQSADFTWYGYSILSNVHHLVNLLADGNAGLIDPASAPRIVDIGAADGDFGFFLDQEGFLVDVVDYGPTNWNGLRGINRLVELLQSDMRIFERNLDAYFNWPSEHYDIAIFLGILYHLKNPFYVLESLAQRSEVLLLSTRIARETPNGSNMEDSSLAYLLGPDECNNDATNFWIFSIAGLEQILRRTGWTVEAIHRVGDREQSNPRDNEHDERVFVLARSRHS